MHNVKKSPASEAQLAARNKERDAKLQAFVEARNAIFGKREKGQLDQQLLELTAELLKKNPDFYTMWNIRRDTIAIMTQVSFYNFN
jgi:geranylgeranyl transferase type-2 subunit alpha